MNTTNDIMSMAQEYASAWPLVGSRFDNGHGMEYAEEARAALLKAVEQLAVDAARYRFLRLNYDDNLVMYGDNSHCEMMMTEESAGRVGRSTVDISTRRLLGLQNTLRRIRYKS